MNNVNDDLPSAADNLGEETDSTSRKVQEALAAAETFAAEIGQRSAEAYRNGNDAVAAAAGFVAGCLWASGSER